MAIEFGFVCMCGWGEGATYSTNKVDKCNKACAGDTTMTCGTYAISSTVALGLNIQIFHIISSEYELTLCPHSAGYCLAAPTPKTCPLLVLAIAVTAVELELELH